VSDSIQDLPLWPQVRLISFGEGSPGIARALSRLERQAKSFWQIDSIRIFDGQDLDPDFFNRFGTLSKDFERGFGLWSWKPYLINREMKNLRDGDILIYLDAGVELNLSGSIRFSEYLDLTAQQEYLLFSQPTPQRQWTKPSDVLLPSDRHYFRNQVVAGILMFQVGPLAKRVVSDWLDMCSIEQGRLLKEPEAMTEELRSRAAGANFIAHRHDQSVLSRVVYEQKLATIRDETYFKPWSLGKTYPFLALRNKQTGVSWVWAALNLWLPIFRMWQYLTLALTPGVAKSKIRRGRLNLGARKNRMG
jgi:hypothetical protein